MTEEVKQQVEEKKEQSVSDMLTELVKNLSNFPDAPGQTKIEEWKQKFGEVFFSGFSELELFIFRPIQRKEYITLQVELNQQQASQFDLEEKMVEICILWTTPLGMTALKNKAGSLSTLYEQIMQNSNFVNPNLASSLVLKL